MRRHKTYDDQFKARVALEAAYADFLRRWAPRRDRVYTD